ncbi:MAG: hypothetical protein JWM96_632 [Alphaproteobacteria bacterium]|nr:hypothetical protein [Alphaproteobacteria bacterium]
MAIRRTILQIMVISGGFVGAQLLNAKEGKSVPQRDSAHTMTIKAQDKTTGQSRRKGQFHSNVLENTDRIAMDTTENMPGSSVLLDSLSKNIRDTFSLDTIVVNDTVIFKKADSALKINQP